MSLDPAVSSAIATAFASLQAEANAETEASVEQLPVLPPMKRRRIVSIWEIHLGLDMVPALTPPSQETAHRVIDLFKEIERTDLPKNVRLRRIIELVYYILARSDLLHERISFTNALLKQLCEWIHHADKEMAVLGVMSTLCVGVMHKELQVQLSEVSYYEHIRECALRLIVLAKERLVQAHEASKSRAITHAIAALLRASEPPVA